MWNKRKKYQLIFAVIVTTLFIAVSAITGNTRDEDIILSSSEQEVSKTEFSDSKSYVVSIDVGQGDCTLIKSYERSFLIDCGTKQSGKTIVEKLKQNDINRLDFILISHPHSDHMGGFIEVADNIDIGNIIIDTISPYDDDESDEYANIIDYCEQNAINILAKDEVEEITLGDVSFSFLPEYPYVDDENDRSIVTKATVDGTTFLFTGDMTSEYEKYLLNIGADIECDVLKVAHHGSRHSSCNRFLRKSRAKIALISAGENNSYSHPHEQTLERLENQDITYYRTDLQGDVVINPLTLSVKCQK